jgi:hypothetical protein
MAPVPERRIPLAHACRRLLPAGFTGEPRSRLAERVLAQPERHQHLDREEVRTIGGEVSVTWLGTRLGHSFDVSAVAAIYEWNDPLGVLIFSRGWGIHDRQTALFGRLPKVFAASTARHGIEFFHEIDDRPGYYAGLQASAYDRFVIRALHYDNRGDPGASNGYENAWLSRFDSAGVRCTFARDWTFIGQWMAGDTSVGASADGRGFLIMDYHSWFGLLSYEFGRNRLTARYDSLYTAMTRGEQFFDAYQDADGWTLAYMLDFNEHWQFVAEALRVAGAVEQRTYIGADEDFTEKTFQLAVRYTF